MNQDALRQIVFDALDLSDELRNECADAVVAALTRNAEPVAGSEKVIIINGRKYRKFIPYPEAVEDGTLRCIRCGQIDEPEYHDDALCAASATPPVAQTGTVRPTEWYPLALRFVRATTPAYDMDLPSFERFVEKIEAIANLPGEGATAPSQEHYYSKAESAYDEGDAGRALSAPTVEGEGL